MKYYTVEVIVHEVEYQTDPGEDGVWEMIEEHPILRFTDEQKALDYARIIKEWDWINLLKGVTPENIFGE